MRTRWPEDFPPVFVHTHWEYNDRPPTPGLADHPAYHRAKKERNIRAAADLIDSIFTEDALDRIVDTFRDRDPIVIAPASIPEQSGNALAITYANWIGQQLNLDVCETVFQSESVGRDGNDYWYRLVNQPKFYGSLPQGRDFIIVDDVMTVGGTLAQLRGFIETQGSRVICMTVLAHRSGEHVRISLAPTTLHAIQYKHGDALDALLIEEVGYGLEYLTEPEAKRLLAIQTLDQIRAALNGAADA